LTFVTSIALAKASGADGRISLRAMVGIQWGAMSPDEVSAAALQLVERRLWSATDDPDTFVVRSFLKWNESAEEVAKRTERKRLNALSTNHKRGLHVDNPMDGCPKCESPGRDADANAPPPQERAHERTQERAHERTQSAAQERAPDADKTRRRPDADDDPPQPPPGDPALDAEAAVVADELLTMLGLFGATARPDEIRYVARAMSRGWTALALADCAAEAAVADVSDVRQYLLGMLRRRANEDGPDATANENTRDTAGWQARATEKRARLDDERTPCDTCATTGWVDVDDIGGGVVRCPDCTAAGVTT
jgi:hypothetical protein